ncbi:MAG: hypothetical protein R2939_21880 [Kofleriaceae bacterium]
MYSAGAGSYGAQLVELGAPYCANGSLSTNGTCDGFNGEFAFRRVLGESWSKGKIASRAPASSRTRSSSPCSPRRSATASCARRRAPPPRRCTPAA